MIMCNHYLERFSRLTSEVQSDVLAGIDNGATVVSTFDLSTGTTACRLTTQPPRVLWEEVLTRPEMVSLSLDAQDVLGQLHAEKQADVEAAIESGARLLVAVCHITDAMEVFLWRDGNSHLLGKRDVPEPVQH